MDHEPQYNADGVEQLPLRSFTEKAYLDYSMYVILDCALPFIGDGLKPVQRRIAYAMSELGLSALEVQQGWGKGYAYDCKASKADPDATIVMSAPRDRSGHSPQPRWRTGVGRVRLVQP